MILILSISLSLSHTHTHTRTKHSFLRCNTSYTAEVSVEHVVAIVLISQQCQHHIELVDLEQRVATHEPYMYFAPLLFLSFILPSLHIFFSSSTRPLSPNSHLFAVHLKQHNSESEEGW